MHRQPFRLQFQPPAAREDPGYEVLPQPGVVQATLLLHRERRHPSGEHRRVEADTVTRRHAVVIIDAHPLHPAAGRLRLEDVSGQPLLAELLDFPLRVFRHAVREILLRVRHHEPYAAPDFARGSASAVAVRPAPGGSLEPNGRTGRTEPDVDLRTYLHPLHVGIQRVHEELVPLVPAVVTDVAAEQAAGDAEADSLRDRRIPFVHSSRLSSPSDRSR